MKKTLVVLLTFILGFLFYSCKPKNPEKPKPVPSKTYIVTYDKYIKPTIAGIEKPVSPQTVSEKTLVKFELDLEAAKKDNLKIIGVVLDKKEYQLSDKLLKDIMKLGFEVTANSTIETKTEFIYQSELKNLEAYGVETNKLIDKLPYLDEFSKIAKRIDSLHEVWQIILNAFKVNDLNELKQKLEKDALATITEFLKSDIKFPNHPEFKPLEELIPTLKQNILSLAQLSYAKEIKIENFINFADLSKLGTNLKANLLKALSYTMFVRNPNRPDTHKDGLIKLINSDSSKKYFDFLDKLGTHILSFSQLKDVDFSKFKEVETSVKAYQANFAKITELKNKISTESDLAKKVALINEIKALISANQATSASLAEIISKQKEQIAKIADSIKGLVKELADLSETEHQEYTKTLSELPHFLFNLIYKLGEKRARALKNQAGVISPEYQAEKYDKFFLFCNAVYTILAHSEKLADPKTVHPSAKQLIDLFYNDFVHELVKDYSKIKNLNKLLKKQANGLTKLSENLDKLIENLKLNK